ncbi:c-type cytochrome [Allochromatium vinosum]|uniref:c-type cytochrome n=1 Tax=Allochromatium vinosum TaxID=1049 RepID=UPI0019089888|nr:c-type cytochrome [Allochromatium vinosum]MBK1655652.1 cytochrome C [Allochromatium vinosum]
MYRLATVFITLGLLSAVQSVGADAPQDDPAELAKREYEQVMTLTPDIDNGRRVYLTCAVCHGPEGWGTPDSAYPQIAGQWREVTIKQLADIRARHRDNPLMYPFSLTRILGGPQNLADVAAYVAALPMTTGNGVGPGVDLELGARLYAEHCADCHGERGEGKPAKPTPAIAAQHFPYLMGQFDAIRSGRRKNANPEMIEQIAGFSPRDQAAVLDYTSRLRPAPEKLAAENWLNPDFPNYVRETMGVPPLPPPPVAPPMPAPFPIAPMPSSVPE